MAPRSSASSRRSTRACCTSTAAPARPPVRGRASRRSAAGRARARPASPASRCTTWGSSSASRATRSSTDGPRGSRFAGPTRASRMVTAAGLSRGSVRDMSLTWPQALAWRMRRQLLDPIGTLAVEDVVRRLGAVQAQLAPAAELSVRTRRVRSQAGEVDAAVAEGRLISAFAFRGATHLMTPEDGGIYLALRAASRMWELRSCQDFYGLTPADWPALRDTVRDVLAGGPVTREELGAGITA